MKTIVLIDLFAGGHRDAFMSLFVEACLQLNVKVICIFPGSEKIKNTLLQKNIRIADAEFIDATLTPKSTNKFGRFNNAVNAFVFWRNYATLFKKIETQKGIKIDLVYFNWLDNLMGNFLPASVLDIVFRYKWSGLYFHPVIFRMKPEYLENKATYKDIDSVFLSKKCVAITSHDEGILEKYQKRIGKKVILFPEIADDAPPNDNFPLVQKIKTNANGRTIIGLIGLDPHKGTFELIKLAKKADASKYYFVFTGWFFAAHFEKYSKDVTNELHDFIKNTPENCLWETGVLKEGEEYNSVFCSFDIIHLLYKEFYSSSNRLTKAAQFNKLVLANNYGCVGDDVLKYNLGETADEDDIEEQLLKIEILRNKILKQDFPYNEWEIYIKKHSAARLKEKFEELLNLV